MRALSVVEEHTIMSTNVVKVLQLHAEHKPLSSDMRVYAWLCVQVNELVVHDKAVNKGILMFYKRPLKIH